MRKLLGLALAGFLTLGVAASAGAATLNYTAKLTFSMSWPKYMENWGLSTVSTSVTDRELYVGPTHLSSLAFAAGQFGPITASLPVTSNLTVNSVIFTSIENLAGTITGISGGPPLGSGRMGLSGTAKICFVFGQPGTCDPAIVFPLTPTPGGAGFGLGGTRTVTGVMVPVTLQHAPWTIGQPTMTIHTPNSTVSVPTLPGGFAHGPASLTSSTAQGGGVLQMVTATKVRTSLESWIPEAPLFSVLNLQFFRPWTLRPGDALVTAAERLVRVDPVSGVQDLLARFVEPGVGLALDAMGRLLISRESAEPPDVLRFDPVANTDTTVTAGAGLLEPRALESEAPAEGEEQGSILVADAGAGELFRMDPETGAQSALAQGGFASGPVGVALEGDGDILVADGSDLVRVNPSTGSKAVVCGGVLVLSSPRALAVGPTGEVFAIDGSAVKGWDPVSCTQTLSVTGGELVEPRDLGVEGGGDLLVVDAGGGGEAKLIRVHSGSGAQEIVASGGDLVGPLGLVVIPPSVMVVHPADAPGPVEMLGGLEEPGGLEVTIDATEGGPVTADYDPLTQQEMNEKVTSGETVPLDFAVPGDTTQLWEIDFGGVFEELVTLVFRYDEALLGPFSEDWLSVYHFLNGAWQRLSGTVDTVANTITVQVDSFSPFVLGVFPACGDGIDNDSDGFTDTGDSGCRDAEDHSEELDCRDGLNNDADGLVDYPEDPGCESADDGSESSTLLVCDDGEDNDGDGRIDYRADPGCADPSSTTESPQCQDGVNNDLGQDPNPGRIDFDGGQSIWGACTAGAGGCPAEVSDPEGDGVANPDPQCVGKPWKNLEKKPRTCGLGVELALLLPALLWLYRRRTRRM